MIMADSEIRAIIAAFEPPVKGLQHSSKPKAKDLTHHLSLESRARKPSPLKEAGLYRSSAVLVEV